MLSNDWQIETANGKAGIEKSQAPVERDILVQWLRKAHISWNFIYTPILKC